MPDTLIFILFAAAAFIAAAKQDLLKKRRDAHVCAIAP